MAHPPFPVGKKHKKQIGTFKRKHLLKMGVLLVQLKPTKTQWWAS